MNNEVKTKTNLEHYKGELKEILLDDYENPREVFRKISKRFDRQIKISSAEHFTDAILNWMAQPYEESVLDDVEKAYLSAVIKPFRNRIRFIVKIRYKLLEQEFIYISVEGNSITFPPFKLGTKYKGMEVNIKYSLEELGL